ncbi:hypothetical protein Patl1_25163 [Pistacia atlantica]|uniref:Uncharacterized protein n=1 Tax=Pistacia atlantica TaxID=434234 RepID=A0ACC1B2G6_9ROSI|nr:hypothetical protein Patl1_25163 [Pistacia atlantica]
MVNSLKSSGDSDTHAQTGSSYNRKDELKAFDDTKGGVNGLVDAGALAGQADSSFLTLLLQDHIGGLQILHENQWVDVTPIPGESYTTSICIRKKMATINSSKIQANGDCTYDRISELKDFDDSKTGVKGLVDSGAAKVPRIFIDEQYVPGDKSGSGGCKFTIPIIDFQGIDKDPSLRHEITGKVGNACEKWGFLQVINHGIPLNTLKEMIDGIRRFHEQDTEVKKSFILVMIQERRSIIAILIYIKHRWLIGEIHYLVVWFPSQLILMNCLQCADILIDYCDELWKFGVTVFGLISEALGLNSNHLKEMGCAGGLNFVGHYYPACPEPELTLGLSKHTDSAFITVLLQDQTGGLQVLHHDQWVDVNPVPGALIVNIGDMLQASQRTYQ